MRELEGKKKHDDNKKKIERLKKKKKNRGPSKAIIFLSISFHFFYRSLEAEGDAIHHTSLASITLPIAY